MQPAQPVADLLTRDHCVSRECRPGPGGRGGGRRWAGPGPGACGERRRLREAEEGRLAQLRQGVSSADNSNFQARRSRPFLVFFLRCPRRETL